MTISNDMRVLLVAEHASQAFGGEAALPLHYFRCLLRRGIPVWLIVHERTRPELEKILPEAAGRIRYVPDTRFIRLMSKMGRRLPPQVSYVTFGYASRTVSQLRATRLARNLVRQEAITVVHQVIPVSPREPSLLWNVGAPVVMGPMNGNMAYPEGFDGSVKGKRAISRFLTLGRNVSAQLHRIMPGKIRAAALLAANERTAKALPARARGDTMLMPENGVDLSVWSPPQGRSGRTGPVRFVFMGRLVDWKATDVLVEAMMRLPPDLRVHLEIIGDGPMRPSLVEAVEAAGLSDRVTFAGWMPQARCAQRIAEADALVLPSIYECGGAVVLEAMACGLPVIATAWGGPLDYIDENCGILVPPASREALVTGFAEAMTRLSSDGALRQRMGAAGRARIVSNFDWEKKTDDIVDIYRRYGRPA